MGRQAKLDPQVTDPIDAIRSMHADLQAQARGIITKGAPGEFLIAVTTTPRMPEWLRKSGLKPMSLGLDLRGGVHFMLQVDMQAAITKKAESYAGDLLTTGVIDEINEIPEDAQVLAETKTEEDVIHAEANETSEQFTAEQNNERT